jgi:hypothetical protein
MTEVPATYSPGPYAPRPTRPPLTQRAKRGAAIAGGVGFVLLGIGWAMVAIPLALVAFAGLIALIVRAARSSGSSPAPQIEQFLSGLDLTPWITLLVVIAIVGLLVQAAAIVLSGRILRAHGVRRPWAVTWAGAGIAIVASWIIDGTLGSLTSAVTSAAFPGNNSGATSWGVFSIVAIVFSGVLGLAVNAAIGWLAWWWMAHAMRPAALADAPPASSTPVVPSA